MNKQIFRFLKTHYSKQPTDVDRLLVSAFLSAYKIQVTNNELLKSYQIKESEFAEFTGLVQFQTALSNYQIKLDIENLIELFEFVISPEDRVVTGAVYTPRRIREYIVKHCLENLQQSSQITVADISCGCGGFLYTAAKSIKKKTGRSYAKIFKEQIFGLDIQEYSVSRTKLLLSLLAISEQEDIKQFDFNLFTGNALSFDWKKKITSFKGFSTIVGNPPYVCSRNIHEDTRPLLANWEVCATGHPDLYIPFFQIAMENIKKDGIVGYITMNTFFKSVNGRAVRAYFKRKKFGFSIVDFGSLQVFGSKSTYTCLCFIKNASSENILYHKCKDLEQLPQLKRDFHAISYAELPDLEGWNLSSKNKIINKIEAVGKPFSQLFITRNGIATLRNEVYIFTPFKKSKRYYYLKTKEGSTFSIEKKACRDIVNPNLLTQQTTLAKIKEKIIFPYYLDEKNEAVTLSEQEFKSTYPKAYTYLKTQKEVLSTRDKGKGVDYKPWFTFGRNQSLEKLRHKLLFPHISPQVPNYVLDSNPDLLFYNGMAIIGKNRNELLLLRKLLSSRLFWFYVLQTSRPYGSSYYSLSRNYIKNFGIYPFNEKEAAYLLEETDEAKINVFIEKCYGITASELKE